MCQFTENKMDAESALQPLTLVLGKMPREADPAKVIAAGPWCFAGQEDFFPEWENRYRFAPEPLENGEGLECAARDCLALCVDNIALVARHLCPDAGKLPDAYWQILLAPWLVDVCRQIVERNLRVQAMIRAYSDMELSVPILPGNCAFDFVDEHDFTLWGSLGTDFNHWLFSRLLEPIWPASWKKIELEPTSRICKDNTQKAPFSWRATAKKLMLGLGFPKLKGMTAFQALKYSLALNHPCNGVDHSLDLKIFTTAHGAHLPLDPLPIFLAALPQSLKDLRHPADLKKNATARVRVGAISVYEDTQYRQKLAIWRARGNRLAYVQHGGNYGQIEVSCDRDCVEYSQDAFFTWGWKKQGKARGNFIPLPYPQLQRIANKWNYSGKEDLLFVGTEMPAYGYRLESRPNPLQTIAYRKDKAVFFENISEELQAKSFYRPYFDIPGTLQDAAWLLPRFPHIRLCEGQLLPRILSCKLLVLDHHGTTMLEALVANTPVVLFWNPESWPLCPEAEKLLEILARAGIWFASPQKAAEKVRNIWGHAQVWWQETEVQKARRLYCHEQALTINGSENSLWIKTLKSL